MGKHNLGNHNHQLADKLGLGALTGWQMTWTISLNSHPHYSITIGDKER
jgi:hypothetical protein